MIVNKQICSSLLLLLRSVDFWSITLCWNCVKVHVSVCVSQRGVKSVRSRKKVLIISLSSSFEISVWQCETFSVCVTVRLLWEWAGIRFLASHRSHLARDRPPWDRPARPKSAPIIASCSWNSSWPWARAPLSPSYRRCAPPDAQYESGPCTFCSDWVALKSICKYD